MRVDTVPPTVKDKGTLVLTRGSTASFAYRLADNLSSRLTCRLAVTQFGKSEAGRKCGKPAGWPMADPRTPVSLPSGCYILAHCGRRSGRQRRLGSTETTARSRSGATLGVGDSCGSALPIPDSRQVPVGRRLATRRYAAVFWPAPVTG